MTRKIETELAQSVIWAAQALEAWHKTSEGFRQMLADFEAIPGCGTISPGRISTSVHISGDKQTLLTCIRLLRRNGYFTTAKPPQPKSAAWAPSYQRTDQNTEEYYKLSQEEQEARRAVWPPVHFYFSSTVCKLVQVGTEMKEVPKYETVCEGGDLTVEELNGQPEGNSMPAEFSPAAEAPLPTVDDDIPF